MKFRWNGLTPISAVPISILDILYTLWHGRKSTLEHSRSNFANEIFKLTGFKNLRTYQSGTLALYQLLKYLKTNDNLKRRDVLIPVYTCPSIYYSVIEAGLNPVFLEIDFSLYPVRSELMKKLSKNTLAIIVVHMYGNTGFDISSIKKEIKSNLNNTPFLIEDFSQTLGDLNHKKINRNYGDYYILSFGRAKMITTVQGGAILSTGLGLPDLRKSDSLNSNKIFRLVFGISIIYLAQSPFVYFWIYKLYNIKRRGDKFGLYVYKKYRFEETTELSKYQYLLGFLMLKKLESFNQRRRVISEYYYKYFESQSISGLPLKREIYWRFPVIFKHSCQKKIAKKNFLKYGIYASTGNYPLLSSISNYTASCDSTEYENASFIAKHILLFPVYPGVPLDRITRVPKLF